MPSDKAKNIENEAAPSVMLAPIVKSFKDILMKS